MNQRLQAIIERAYTLSAQVLNGDEPDIALAEELSGETAELLAHASGDTGAFESEEVMDMELVALVKQLAQRRSKYETITVNGYWNAIPELGLPEIEPFENMTVALGSWDGEEDADDERIFFYLDGKTPIGNHGEFTITEII